MVHFLSLLQMLKDSSLLKCKTSIKGAVAVTFFLLLEETHQCIQENIDKKEKNKTGVE